VRLAQTLLDRHGRIYGTRSANSGIPRDQEGEGKRSKNEKSAFWRNGDVMVQVIRTIHDATVVNKGRKDENIDGNKELLCCCPVQ
jgi:hypothetical protein